MDNKVPLSKEMCTGCTACANICPVNAIKMQRDSEGFLYPEIDKSICISCELCVNNCYFCKEKIKQDSNENKNCYLAKHKRKDVRMNSRSGGIFVACSDWILEQNGTVYGCVLNDDMEAIHIRATNKQDRDKMCKSKYVQSNLVKVFSQVKDDLNLEKLVLFSGTTCQIDGLFSYLKYNKVNLEKLYTIDLVCHGCASPKIFESYVKWIEKKYKTNIEKFDFRDKEVCGWDGHIESYIVNGKKKTSTIYREIFYTNLCLRPACYKCKYSTIDRNTDLTIADAWGVKQTALEFYDNLGTSMFLVQSNKGMQLLEIIKKSCEILEVPLEKMMQPNLKNPSKPKGNRETFWEDFYNGGIETVIRKYGKMKLSKNIKEKAKYKIRKIMLGKKIYLP